MCNKFFGVNSSSKSDTISSNLANPVIVGELLEPNDLETVLKDIDEELCRVGEVDLALKVFKVSNTREGLRDPLAILTKSRAAQVAPKVSLTNESTYSPKLDTKT